MNVTYVDDDNHKGYEGYLDLLRAKKPEICFKNVNSYFVASRNLYLLLEYCSTVLKSYTHSTGAMSYVADLNKGIIYNVPHKLHSARDLVTFKIESGKTLAAHVAWAKENVVVNDVIQDGRFPLGVAWKDSIQKRAMCVPVLTPNDLVVAVLELTKDMGGECYTIDELEAAITLANWIGTTIYNAHETQMFLLEKQMNKYILQLINLFYTTHIPVQKILSEILLFTKKALNAVKCIFYILYKTHEDDFLVVMYNDNEESYGHEYKLYFMLSRSKTVAAYVARTKKLLNTTDIQFQYDTSIYSGIIPHSILATPVRIQENVLGIIEMINKREAEMFTDQDEKLMECVASHCLIVFAYHVTSTNLKQLESRMEVNDELLSLHMQPCEHDTNELITPVISRSVELFKPTYYPKVDTDIELCKLAKLMYSFVMGKSYTERLNLNKFLLLVAKLHTKDEFINFQHTFCTFQAVANIFYNNPYDFTIEEKEDMLIAALCHTVDRKGYLFTKDSDDNSNITACSFPLPLRLSFYFVIRLFKNCNIFTHMIHESAFEKKLKSLHTLIRACSFQNTMRDRHELYEVLMKEHFDWNNSCHRHLMRSIVMMISELSYYYKYPFIAVKIFNQKLNAIKKTSIESVYSINHDSKTFIAEEQLEFLKIMIIPSLHLLKSIFPNTEGHIFSCEDVMNEWLTILKRFEDPVWQPEQSYSVPTKLKLLDVEELCTLFKKE